MQQLLPGVQIQRPLGKPQIFDNQRVVRADRIGAGRIIADRRRWLWYNGANAD